MRSTCGALEYQRLTRPKLSKVGLTANLLIKFNLFAMIALRQQY